MLQAYFKNLYKRTMSEAYTIAKQNIRDSVAGGGRVLDCGASNGGWSEDIKSAQSSNTLDYFGIEWDHDLVSQAQSLGRNVIQGDLNKPLPYHDNFFDCIFALSLVEHLLNPCLFLRECQRSLSPGGNLILLTPNISTYFTIALLIAGKMPSSGPHPDSESLVLSEELFRVQSHAPEVDLESDTPVHRHLVVFSYRVLKRYLEMLGFSRIQGYGFGLYPFPNFMQPLLERVDPYHCHQIVFIARK